MPHVLFFDLDGTLCDTHGLCRATWLEVLRPYGIDVDFNFYQQNVRGRPYKEVIQALLPDLPDGQSRWLLEAEASSYRNRTKGAGPLPGLSNFLEAGRQRARGLGLVTNAPEASAHESLQSLGLDEAFDCMVFPEEAGAHKPDPASYRLALKKLDVSPDEALAFEDSPKGITAAVRAGIPVIGIVSTHHPAELREAGAALVVGDFADRVLYDLLDDPDILNRWVA